MRKYFLAIALLSSYVSYAQSPAYKNKQLSPDVRAKDLLARMTLEEKVMQTQCFWGQKAGLLNELGSFDEASVTVKNTGTRAGAEVVQLYVRDDYSSVPRPVMELKGFQKIWLEAGQSQTVRFTIDAAALSFYNKDMKWVVEPGTFTIMAGTASDKTTSVSLTVIP